MRTPLRSLFLALAAAALLQAQGAGKSVLFDHTHHQEGGTSAEWVICTGHEPDPSPANPAKETDWNGGLSALAFDLHTQGYKVQTLPASGGRITYGDSSNPQDLSRYSVFFIPECYTYFSPAEKAAIVAFVQHGGGLFLVGNHQGAARVSSSVPGSTDAFSVFNDLVTNNGVANNAFGFTWVVGHGPGDANANTTSSAYSSVVNPTTNALLRGPNGTLTMQDFHSYAYLSVNPANNPTAIGLLSTQVPGDSASSHFLAACSLGSGRVVATGDSSPSDDGTTTTSGKSLHDSYTINSNRAFFLNAVAWLAGSANTVSAAITAPAANASVGSGAPVSFAGSATDSSPSATLSYAWDFGDGSVATGASASHTYTNAGPTAVSYTVTFTATDNTGAKGTASRTITVDPPPPSSFTLTASAGSGGSISPSGVVSVASGGSQTFTITANAGYRIGTVTVDGVAQGALASYTFPNVKANHSIAATFLAGAGSVLNEGFETGTKGSYTSGNVTFGSGTWTLNDALLGTSSSDPKTGSQSVRLRNSGKLTMKFNWAGGARTVSIKHASFGSDAATTWNLWYSTNGGSTWTQAGSTVTTASPTLQTATFTVNVTGAIRFEVRKSDGSTRRLNLDDLVITGY